MELTNLNKDRKQRRKTNTLLVDGVHGKIPPQAKDLEDAVLGACMLQIDAIDTATSILKPEHFYVEANQRIFRSMMALVDKNSPVDMMTVVSHLQGTQELDLVGGPYYVSKLTNAVVSGANVEAHSRIVIQKFLQREMIRVAVEIMQEAYEDSNDVFDMLDSAEDLILGIGTENVFGGMTSLQTVLHKALKQVEEWRTIDTHITGVPSGYDKLDRVTRGWQPGDLIILGARPSVGKTAFALNLVMNAALNNPKKITVGLWSLEMSAVMLALRILAAESKILMDAIQTGKLEQGQMDILYKTVNTVLQNANVKFDESDTITLRTFSAKARRLKKQAEKNGVPLGLIVIDYLQLMEADANVRGNREQEISKISRGLKKLAKSLHIPIIALSQLSRDTGHSKVTWQHGPGLSALRESGAIEQDADVVLMLWGPSDDDIAANAFLVGKRKIRVAKQRNGMLLTVDFDFKNEYQLFQDIEDMFPDNWKPVKSAAAYDPTISKAERIEGDGSEDLPF